MSKLYNLVELSERLKVTYRTMQNYVYTGAIKAEKIGGRWYVNESELKKFLAGKKNTGIKFAVSDGAWDYFKKFGCIRAEVGNETPDFMRGYVKGLQVALIDLLNQSGLEDIDFMDDIAEIQSRIEKLDREIKATLVNN